MGAILEIVDLHCGYKHRKIVKGISLNVNAGQILCLLGPNGVGKTTFFKAMLGFLKIMGGEILLKGRSIKRFSYAGIARTVGYVPQSHTPPFPFSVIDVVTMGRTSRIHPFASPSARDYEIARLSIETLGIGHLKDAVYTEISGGERQLVLIARAIAQEPEILVMDEPTSNLDFGNQVRVLDGINNLARQGLGVIMTTHFPNHAFLSGDSVALMKSGRIITTGAPEAVITEANMRLVYGIDVKMTTVSNNGHGVRICVPLLSSGVSDNGPSIHAESHPLPNVTDMNMEIAQTEDAAEIRPVRSPETKLVTDMAGRRVTVNARITNVFGYNPMVTALMFALSPDTIAGFNMPPMPPEQMVADAHYLSLPVLGIMGPPFGGPGQTLNRDAVLKAAPDVIISMALSKIDDIEVRAAEKLQEELNIPVLIYDGALDRSGEVLRRVGALVGAETRGEALADYFEARFAKIQRNLAGIPRAERRTVYYAQSPTGMLTDPAGARHSEIIDFAGGVNIAETYEQRGCGRTKISADDLMRWDPDVIIMMSDEGRSADRLYTRMKADPFWSALTAVRKGRYYEPPAGMYHWLDRPPSVNRIIGLIWLANLLYPYHFDWDMVAETRTFYQLFYRLNLSRKQAETILGMHN